MKRISFFLLVLACGFSLSVQAQTTFSFSSESTVVVEGASNKSDWTVKAEEIQGQVELHDGVPQSAMLTIPVAMMKSGRSMIMDRLMRGAFNVDENPDISFSMTEANLVEGETFDVSGTLTMAGKTNPVTLQLVRSVADSGMFVFTGSHLLNMRDYDMDPPTAMFGALLTKPEVTIQFNLVTAE